MQARRGMKQNNYFNKQNRINQIKLSQLFLFQKVFQVNMKTSKIIATDSRRTSNVITENASLKTAGFRYVYFSQEQCHFPRGVYPRGIIKQEK